MLKLDYELSAAWNSRLGLVALGDADELVLRYDCFLGDVVFMVYEVDLSARWGWIPILDFALSLDAIVGRLEQENGHEVFEFTESDATIAFRREGEKVEIEASYVPVPARATLSSLQSAAKLFLARVVDDLVLEYPELRLNPFVADISKKP